MCTIEKRISKKTNKEYYCLCVNGVMVAFDYIVILRVAETRDISNLDLSRMQIGDIINL